MKKIILSLTIILCAIFGLTSANIVDATTKETSYNLLAPETVGSIEQESTTRELLGVKWSTIPVKVYADSSFNAIYISQLQEAISAWNSTRVGTVLTYAGTRANPSTVMGSIGVTQAPISGFGTVGLTTTIRVSPTSSDILRSIVTLNSNFSFNNGATTTGTYYLKSVFMHELGHALGLADNEDPSSIMYELYTGRTTLSSMDVDDLDSLY